MSRIGVHFETRNGTLLASADLDGGDGKPRWWVDGPLFLDELDSTGSFTVNVQLDATDLYSVILDSIMVVSIDAVERWRGVVRRKVTREVAVDEAGRYIEFSGLGEVDRLSESVVYPSDGLGRFPFADERTFNWTAPEYDDAGVRTARTAWSAVTETARQYMGEPEGWPDPVAQWIWWEDSSVSTDAAVIYMRGTGTAATTATRQAWSASDDRNEIWIQGVDIHKSSDGYYIGNTTSTEVKVSSGSVLVAAKVTNVNDAKAGLLFSLLNPFDTGESPIVQSLDTTFKFRPDGEQLGMNPGEIFTVLRSEAIARGETMPAITFDADVDTDGTPWSVYEELTVQVGATYREVLEQMVELEMCEFRMSPGSYELNVYNPGAAGSVVAYELDTSTLTSLEWEEVSAEANALLTRWQNGYTDTENATLVTEHGRRVKLLSLAGAATATKAATLADSVIDRLGAARLETAFAYEPATTTDEPYAKFSPGDSITVPAPLEPLPDESGDPLLDENLSPLLAGGSTVEKVLAVAMGVDNVGHPRWEVHVNSHIEELDKRQQRLLDLYSQGGLSGRTRMPIPPKPPIPLKPREPREVDWSTYGEIATGIGPSKDFSRDVHVREVRMRLEGSGITGTYTARLLKNGSAVTGTTISLTAAGRDNATLALVVLRFPTDYLEMEITAVGANADRLTYTVVYA